MPGVRWRGRLTPRVSGRYQLGVLATCRTQINLNGSMVAFSRYHYRDEMADPRLRKSEWLELQAMKTGARKKNDDFIGSQFKLRVAAIPVQAGLDRWLKLDKGSFLGREALEAVRASGGPKRKIVGLEMLERGIARDGYAVFDLDGNSIGAVTSGSPAPFLKTNIAMALVSTGVAASGADVLVDVRGSRVRAKQVPLPFYKRPKK